MNQNSIAERVFKLVRNLQGSERKKLLSSIGKDEAGLSASKQNYIRLFRVYSNSSKFDLTQFTKKFNENPNSFRVANRDLRRFLLDFLAKLSTKNPGVLQIAKIAVENGFPKYAKSILQKAIEKEDSIELTSLKLSWFNYLEVIDKYYLDGAKDEIATSFYEDTSTQLRVKFLERLLIKSIRESEEEKNRIIRRFQPEFRELEDRLFSPKTTYHVLKATLFFNFFTGNHDDNPRIHNRVVQIIQKFPSQFEPEVKLNEFYRSVLFRIMEQEFDSARDLLTEIGASDYPEGMMNQTSKIWLICSVYLAAASADFAYISRATRDFEKFAHLVSSKEKVRLAHAISLLFFFSGDWMNALAWQNKISSFPVRNELGLSWTPILMKALVSIETGYLQTARETVKSFLLDPENEKHVFCFKVLGWLHEILSLQGFETKNGLVFHSPFESLKTLKKENREFRTQGFDFPIQFWFESKISGRPLKEVVLKNLESGTLLFKVG